MGTNEDTGTSRQGVDLCHDPVDRVQHDVLPVADFRTP